jgi:creatinine amidohydrolase/Fe(II)-dependent formamide hydrolase-like protein
VILPDPRVEEATDPVLARYGVTREEGGIHSGFVETSELLASPYGHLVDMPAAERGFVGDVWTRIAEATKEGRWNLADVSPVGVLGDPTKASAEAGRELDAAANPVYLEIVKEALDSEDG